MRFQILFAWFFVVAVGFHSCQSDPSLPEDAKKPIPIQILRFDEDLFSIDTGRLNVGLDQLNEKYPDFFPSYLMAIVGINPMDPQAETAMKAFLSSYRPVFEKAKLMANANLPAYKNKLETALQWMHYLVPEFQVDSPFVVTPFVGPLDAFEAFSIGDYGEVRTNNGVGIAMQFHLGGNESLYIPGMETGIFSAYQVRRFEPDMMLVNTMKTLIDDAFPYRASGKPMIEEMIEKGKRMYLLKRILPEAEDSLLIGYTGMQWKGCMENEALIWQFFVKNDLLYTIDGSITQGYLRDGPKTPELGEASPGYIGLFTGWRIVETFMEKQKGLTINELMKLPASRLFQESGYRP